LFALSSTPPVFSLTAGEIRQAENTFHVRALKLISRAIVGTATCGFPAAQPSETPRQAQAHHCFSQLKLGVCNSTVSCWSTRPLGLAARLSCSACGASCSTGGAAVALAGYARRLARLTVRYCGACRVSPGTLGAYKQRPTLDTSSETAVGQHKNAPERRVHAYMHAVREQAHDSARSCLSLTAP